MVKNVKVWIGVLVCIIAALVIGRTMLMSNRDNNAALAPRSQMSDDTNIGGTMPANAQGEVLIGTKDTQNLTTLESIVSNPESMIGQRAKVRARMKETLGAGAFVLEPLEGENGQPLPVVADLPAGKSIEDAAIVVVEGVLLRVDASNAEQVVRDQSARNRILKDYAGMLVLTVKQIQD